MPTKGRDELVEAIKNVSKVDEMQQGCGSHLVIDSPILHDNALPNEEPGHSKAEEGASGPKRDVLEIVVDIDKISAAQHNEPEKCFEELNGSQQISNLGSSCSRETCNVGESHGESNSAGTGDGMSEGSQHVDLSPEIGDDHSCLDYVDDQAKLDQPIARLEDGGGVCLNILHSNLQMGKMDGDEVMSGHATSDPGFIYAAEHVGQSLIPSGDEKVSCFVRSAGGSCSDDLDSLSGRVKAWINSIELSDMVVPSEEEDTSESGKLSELIHNESPAVMHHGSEPYHTSQSAVHSLHPSSTVAHISGFGLREVPPLGMFSSLRTLNLSANAIAGVPVGCLPRGLHSLDLSRNRIAQIEGFRELTRLRVLNLSYNRISRIGHGLANCTLVKELYLAGNKIAEVEGLHRLLKVAVLDLDYNKITTPKALGQLAANYGSLLALNLVGNPILTNFSEDQLRKLVTALAPHLTYLNRQPIKMVSVRGAALDSITRAALGTPQRTSKPKGLKKPSIEALVLVQKKPPPHHHTAYHSQKEVGSRSSSGQRRYHNSQHQHRPQAGSLKEQCPKPVAPPKLVGVSQVMHRSSSADVFQE